MDDLPVSDPPFELADSASDGMTEQTLRGEIEKVSYENDDNSYTVLLVRDGSGSCHTVVGSLPGVSAGQGIEAAGRWEVHKGFGRQLSFARYPSVASSKYI